MKGKQYFIWKGLDHSGRQCSGEINAESATAAKIALYHSKIHCTQLHARSIRKGRTISASGLADLLQQLAAATEAGVSIVTALELISTSTTRATKRKQLLEIRNEIINGALLSKAMGSCLNGSDNIVCQLVSAGERSGMLGPMLRIAANAQEQLLKLRSDIRQALFYPLIVSLLAIATCGFMLVWTVPRFVSTYSNYGVELPTLTRWVIDLSELLTAPEAGLILLILPLLAFAAWLLFRQYLGYPLERLCRALPVIGSLLYCNTLSRYCKVTAVTLEAGLAIGEALECGANASGSIIMKSEHRQLMKHIVAGSSLQDALAKRHLSDPLLRQMVAVGETGGRLAACFELTADRYRQRSQVLSKRLTALLEPLIILVLGLLTGILTLAMYLPIFQLGAII